MPDSRLPYTAATFEDDSQPCSTCGVDLAPWRAAYDRLADKNERLRGLVANVHAIATDQDTYPDADAALDRIADLTAPERRRKEASP